MLTFITWAWRGHDPKRWVKPEYINALHRMLAEHYHAPFRVVCFTDAPEGIIPEIECKPLPPFDGKLMSPHGKGYPSCYRRLWLFSREAAEMFPGHIVNIDVDTVICDDVTDMFDLSAEFIISGDPDSKRFKYNGGLWMLKTGTRTHVWDTFDPATSPGITLAAGLVGSDQAWISYCLDNERVWKASDGLYKSRNVKPGIGKIRILQTPSIVKPWSPAFAVKFKRYADIWRKFAYPESEIKVEPEHKEGTGVRLRLLTTTTRGRKGQIIVMPSELIARELIRRGIAEAITEKAVEVEPEKPVEIEQPAPKRRGRPRKTDASDTANAND